MRREQRIKLYSKWAMMCSVVDLVGCYIVTSGTLVCVRHNYAFVFCCLSAFKFIRFSPWPTLPWSKYAIRLLVSVLFYFHWTLVQFNVYLVVATDRLPWLPPLLRFKFCRAPLFVRAPAPNLIIWPWVLLFFWWMYICFYFQMCIQKVSDKYFCVK